jgi:hypothetical protein
MEHCPKLQQSGAVSRRTFLFLGAAAGVTLAAYPLTDLFTPAQVPQFQTIDGILKEVYEDYVSDMVNQPTCLGRIIITGEQIAASRDQSGQFVSAMTRNLQEIARAVAEREERAILRTGRRPLVGGRRRRGVQWA